MVMNEDRDMPEFRDKTKFICVHGHFYQPPRENPWLEAIELQDSAYPYRDWNERITAECYGPNTASRILDENQDIADIVNNFAKISFNFGPTLLSWMQIAQPEIYQAILEADRISQTRYSGHGAAIAQAYNHMIMPLANARDKHTQVIWGLRDFEERFNRKAEGMWLPETAVDLATLEVLAQHGVKFTILAPGQMKAFRKIGEKQWQPASGVKTDWQRAYRCVLPSGKKMALFFYDGGISHEVAFGGLLNNGDAFARALLAPLPANPPAPALVHIATDGETFGHHHRFGNMALSYCLRQIERGGPGQLTVYGEFLDRYPPEYEAEIVENSSWSCSHGVERWRNDCGCRIGDRPGWHQKWRAPLRAAMDGLRDQLIEIFAEQMRRYFKDPWQVRDEYIQILLDRSRPNVDAFLRRTAYVDLQPDDQITILKLLEMQRFAMYMYTSCGWFFDDISGLETTQIIQYAARAIQLAREVSGVDLQDGYIEALRTAVGNVPERPNGAVVYEKYIQPKVITPHDIAAHFAISSLFEEYQDPAKVYAYTIRQEQYQRYETGRQSLALGSAVIASDITHTECPVDFAVLHLGDYNLYCGVRDRGEPGDFDAVQLRLREVFFQNNIPGVIQLLNEHLGKHNYSLWNLFKNEQGKVLKQVFNNTLGSIEAHFREIYEHYYPLMQIQPDFRIALPKALSMSVEFVLNRDIVETLAEEDLDLERLQKVATEIKRWSFMRDMENLTRAAAGRIDKLMRQFSDQPQNIKPLKTLLAVLRILGPLSLPLDLWRAQNIFFVMAREVGPLMRARAQQKDSHAAEWLEMFSRLGRQIKVRMDSSVTG